MYMIISIIELTSKCQRCPDVRFIN